MAFGVGNGGSSPWFTVTLPTELHPRIYGIRFDFYNLLENGFLKHACWFFILCIHYNIIFEFCQVFFSIFLFFCSKIKKW